MVMLYGRVSEIKYNSFSDTADVWPPDRLKGITDMFVFVGPNEVTLFGVDAYHIIHGTESTCKRAAYYDILHPMVSLDTTRDPATHASRRKLWDQAFSIKGETPLNVSTHQSTFQFVDHEACCFSTYYSMFSLNIILTASSNRNEQIPYLQIRHRAYQSVEETDEYFPRHLLLDGVLHV